MTERVAIMELYEMHALKPTVNKYVHLANIYADSLVDALCAANEILESEDLQVDNVLHSRPTMRTHWTGVTFHYRTVCITTKETA